MEIWLFNNLGLDIIIRDHYQGLYIQVNIKIGVIPNKMWKIYAPYLNQKSVKWAINMVLFDALVLMLPNKFTQIKRLEGVV